MALKCDDQIGDCPRISPPPTPGSAPPASPPEFRVVALGDSVMWGQGLAHRNKFSVLVTAWLGTQLNKTTGLELLAHSGANATYGGAVPQYHGEVPSDTPDILSQMDMIADPDNVDLVLINGCANDIKIKTIFQWEQSLGEFRAHVSETCLRESERILRKVLGKFKHARVVVTGLYPIFSERSEADWLPRLLSLFMDPAKLLLPGKPDIGIIARRSDAWANLSSQAYKDVILMLDQTQQDRVRFVDVDKETWKRHAYGMEDSWVWPLLPTGDKFPDEAVSERLAACDERYSGPSIIGGEKYLCRNASLGHPNVKGALEYARAIKVPLQAWIDAGVIAKKPPSPPPGPYAPPAALEPNAALALNVDGKLEALVNGRPYDPDRSLNELQPRRNETTLLHGRQLTPGGSWGSFTRLPGAELNGAGTPAFGRNVDGSLIAFAVQASKLWIARQVAPVGEWTVWQASTGPSVVDHLTVGRTGDGPGGRRVIAFVPGADGSLLRTHQEAPNGTTWKPMISLANSVVGRPAVAEGPDGSLHVVTRVTKDKSLFHLWQGREGMWQPIARIGGSFTSWPAAAFGRDGTLDVFARGDEGALFQSRRSDNGTWGPWTYLGGQFLSTPVVIAQADGRLVLFGKEETGLKYLVQPDGGWGDGAPGKWMPIGGTGLAGYIDSAPTVERDAAGRIVLMVTTTLTRYERDNVVAGRYLYQTRQTSPNGSWGGWEKVWTLEETRRPR